MTTAVHVDECVGCARELVHYSRTGEAPVGDGQVRYYARGRCTTCYRAEVPEYARTGFSRGRHRDDVLNDYVFMRSVGVSNAEMHTRLRMSRDAFTLAMRRAQRAGDPRSVEYVP